MIEFLDIACYNTYERNKNNFIRKDAAK
jgi:hypothetical protein